MIAADLAVARAQPSGPLEALQQVAGVLDYIAGDYRGAVKPDGSVANQGELTEQRALAKDADALSAQAGLAADAPLRVALGELTQALAARRPPPQVEALCQRAREIIVHEHHVDLTPATMASLTEAERLYATQGCTTCHGADGGAHTPTALTLDPRPANFLDPKRVATLSAHRAYHALTYGVPGTAMQPFAKLTDAQRWSLAFYVLSLRHREQNVAAGREALSAAHADVPTDARGLSGLTEEALAARLASIADPHARNDALAYLRTVVPFEQASPGSFGRAYAQLDAGLAAYLHGDRERARRAFISAYLDGVEPHEAALRARDPQLVQEIEHAMLALRSAAADGRRPEQLKAAVTRARGLLDRAHLHETSARTVFLGAMTIALREGVEIVLLVAALLGLVRKRGTPQLAKYVHAGWILAIPAGLATFAAAQSLLSGMRRELAEGIASLLAALVLLGVTHWLLGQLSTKRWVGFLANRMGTAAAGSKAALGVLSLAFLAAYREAFEIVLFYQALALDAGRAVHQVWLGAAFGLGLLCIVAFALLRLGQRLRPAPFMLASSLCLAALAWVLVGKGIHALQVAAAISMTQLGMPELPSLGVYATVEGLLAQGGLWLVLVVSALLPMRRARRAAAEQPTAAQ